MIVCRSTRGSIATGRLAAGWRPAAGRGTSEEPAAGPRRQFGVEVGSQRDGGMDRSGVLVGDWTTSQSVLGSLLVQVQQGPCLCMQLLARTYVGGLDPQSCNEWSFFRDRADYSVTVA